MGLLERFFRPTPPAVEQRASGGGFTALAMAARAEAFNGPSGVAELTATAQAAVSLWEGAFAAADVTGTDLLTRRSMALAGRMLALRGEVVFLIGEAGLVAASEWDVTTRNGEPRAYRLTLPETGGGRSVTALAAEVLHFRHGSAPEAPWAGTSPLRRARLSADLLAAVEAALAEVWGNAPVGSQVVSFPESPETDMEALARGFRGKRGRVLLRESVQVTAAGGAAPAQDWKPQQTTPDLRGAEPVQMLAAAREAILLSFGILPSMFDRAAAGPLVREGQRHLACWVLQPLAGVVAEEASEKLGARVEIDTLRALQAWDAGGRARALGGYIEALARAKEAGLTPGEVAEGLRLVDWGGSDGTA